MEATSQTNGARVLTLASPVAQGPQPAAPISETTAGPPLLPGPD